MSAQDTSPFFPFIIHDALCAIIQEEHFLACTKKTAREMRYRKEERAREARKAYVYVYMREGAGETSGGGRGRRSERIAFAYCARGLPRIMPD